MNKQAVSSSAWTRALRPFAGPGGARWIAAGLLAAAAWGPTVDLPRPVHSVLMCFDLTQSMGVADMPAERALQTRLDAAKAAARHALAEMPCGTRVGWAAFADYRVMPLIEPLEVCTHYDALIGALENLDFRMRWANASQVAKGVYWSLRAATAMSERPTVVFFSDGQEAPPIPRGANPALALDAPHPGLVVGVGGDTPQPIPRTDVEGRSLGTWQPREVVQRADLPPGTSHEELSALDEGQLQALAQGHGLRYLRLRSPESLWPAVQAAAPARWEPAPVDLSPVLGALGLALLAGPWLRQGWQRWRALRGLRRAVEGPRADLRA